MAIVGIGLDVVELARIARMQVRFGQALARRILTAEELRLVPMRTVPYLAARFAGKEAAVKALGTGFTKGIIFQHIEIITLDSGQPTLTLSGKAAEVATALGVSAMYISLTHGRDTAAAVVILER